MTVGDSGIAGDFNERVDKFPQTGFVDYLRWLPAGCYGDKTAKNILDVFKKLGLPLPQDKSEFMSGNEGGLVLLERYGLVLRIERKELLEHYGAADSGSPWIMKPLASIDVGNAVIRLCPGCAVANEKDEKQRFFLKNRLRQQGIYFWDAQSSNYGSMPIRTPSFPDGIPVVIDRGAVKKLTDDIEPVKTALEHEAAEATEGFYGPLRQAFEDAWPDQSGPSNAVKMKQFWDLCADYKRDGKLVAGWREEGHAFSKTEMAAQSASAYEARLKSTEQAAITSATVPQPRR